MTKREAEKFAEALTGLLSAHDVMLHVDGGEICVRRMAGDAPVAVEHGEDGSGGYILHCYDWMGA